MSRTSKHAISYLRISGESQVNGDGFPRQGICTDKYADTHGYTVDAVFLERAVCGANEALDRPAFMDALVYMAERGITVILVEDFRRFARDLIVQELLIRDLRKAGIHLIDCTTNTDMTIHESDDPTAVLIRQILGALSQWERLTIVIRLRMARMRKKAATGRCEGVAAYGYDPQRPAEVPTLARMVALRKRGMTQLDVATTLNAEGTLTREGKQWDNQSISRTLRKHKRLSAFKKKTAQIPNGAARGSEPSA